MEHPMRRKDRQLDREQAKKILMEGEYGVLATVGEDMQPYGVPLSYSMEGDCIWFHCAASGHKLDNLRHNDKASFTVVGSTKAVYLKDFTTKYESAVAFGRVTRVEEPEEKIKALKILCEKYLPEHMDKFDESIRKALHITDIWRIDLEQIAGKSNR